MNDAFFKVLKIASDCLGGMLGNQELFQLQINIEFEQPSLWNIDAELTFVNPSLFPIFLSKSCVKGILIVA